MKRSVKQIAKEKGKDFKIYLRGLNWVGDAVMSTPALRHVRRSFPEAQITLMVRPWVASVYENNPDIDHLWVHDDSASQRAFFKAVRMIRKERFDVGIALPNSIRSAALMWAGGIRRRIGFRRGAGRSLFLTHPIPLRKSLLNIHQAYYYLGLVEPLCGPGPKAVRQILSPGETEIEEVDALLGQLGLDRGQTLIGFAPGSINSNAKRWPAENFARLADRIDAELGASILLLGSGKEKDVLDRVESLTQCRVHNLAGKANLSQAIALIDRLEALVTNDAGGMHIAAALGIPTVAIFGPTEWDATYPLSPAARLVRKEGVECAPCMLRECPIEGHPCMTGVTIPMVYEAFETVLKHRRLHPESESVSD